jgi:hypothetical protein
VKRRQKDVNGGLTDACRAIADPIAITRLNTANFLLGKPAQYHAPRVEFDKTPPRQDRIGWQVSGDRFIHADHAKIANRKALMHNGMKTKVACIAKYHMPGKGCAIGKLIVVSNAAIMCNMAIRHQIVAATDNGFRFIC